MNEPTPCPHGQPSIWGCAVCLPEYRKGPHCQLCGGAVNSGGRCVDGQCAGSSPVTLWPAAQIAHTQPGESEAAPQEVLNLPKPMAEWTERERAAWRLGVREDARNNRNSVLEGMDRSHGIGCLAHHAEGFAVACARIREEVAEIETAHLSVVQSEDPQWWDGLSHGAQTALAIIDRIAGEGM